MTIEWYDDLLTGHSLIDDQHKELFKRINGLLEACTAGKGSEEISQTFLFLDEYVIRHFRDEEDLQEKYGYPDIEEHKDKHKKFRTSVKVLQTRLNDEGLLPHIIVLANHTLVDWLIHHIGEQDKKLAKFIRQKKKNKEM